MTEETKRDVATSMRAAGESVRSIAAKLGVPPSTVQDWTRTSEPRTADDIQAVSKEREAKAVALFKDGQSARQVGTELGISHMQVTRLLRRAGVMVVLLAALSLGAPPADAARWTVGRLADNARGSAWACDFDHDHRWGPKQNQCVVRVVFRREPRVAVEAARIIACETGGTWDEYAKNRHSTASGLAQFLRGTWRSTPYRRHSVFHPVYNVQAMQWLYHANGESWRAWVCKP